jgi:hypothetical protein
VTKFSRKQKVVVASIVGAAVVVAGAGTAYAYWSANGTGTGNAALGSGTNDLQITNTTPTGLVPGGSYQVSGLITNVNTKTSEYVVTVSGVLSIDSAHALCSASDFSLSSAAVNKAVAANNGTQTFAATLSMTDTGVNQDACKGATVNIAWSSV